MPDWIQIRCDAAEEEAHMALRRTVANIPLPSGIDIR